MEPAKPKTVSFDKDTTFHETKLNPSIMSQIQKSARSFCDAFALAWDRLPSIRKTSAKKFPMKTENEGKKYEGISKVATESISNNKISNKNSKTFYPIKKNTVTPKTSKESPLEKTKSDDKLLRSISNSASSLNKTSSKKSNPSSSSTINDQSESPVEVRKTTSKMIKKLSKLANNENSNPEPPSSVVKFGSKMFKKLNEKRVPEGNQTTKTQSSQKIQTPIVVDDKAKYAAASKLIDKITAHVKESRTEGVFRVSGTLSTVQGIYTYLMENPQSDIPEVIGNTSVNINDLSSVLKKFLEDNRPITGNSREAYLQVGRSLKNEERNETNTDANIQKLKKEFDALEPSQRQLLKEIISMCNTLLDDEISDVTLMKSENLAITLGNSLFDLQTFNDAADSQKAFEFLLIHHDKIFS